MAMALSLSRLASPQLRTLFRRRLAGLGAMVLAAAAVALFATLLTYDAHDPSLNTATAQAARNLFGVPGAMTADFLLQGFGAASVLPGLALLAWAWRLGIGNGGGRGSALWRIIALLADAGFYVGNDTGVMNIAAAAGLRSYGLFGATPALRHSGRILPIVPQGGIDRANGMARITCDQVLATVAADRGMIGPIP